MGILNQALIITAIGMGLVFVAILLLWGLMELIVRFTAEKKVAEKSAAVEIPLDVESPASPVDRRKQAAAVAVSAALASVVAKPGAAKAAAVAVAVALALQSGGKSADVVSEPMNRVSPWQSMMRARQIAGNYQVYKRKL